MIKLNEVKNYKDLIKLKKKNTEIKSKNDCYITICMVIAVILFFYVGISALILGIVVSAFILVKNSIEVVPNYEKYYYKTFFPNLLEYMEISDLTKLSKTDGENLLSRSGLKSLTDGSIDCCTCFLKKHNEYNYFGFYKKSEATDDDTEITFDGLFFVKELQEPLFVDLKIQDFRLKESGFLNQKGYSGSVKINQKNVVLNEKCIKLLGELENRYGRVYMVSKNNYLSIQFLDFGTCSKYSLDPYLEDGCDTEDHFRIIELSRLEDQFSTIIEELLGEFQFLK